MLDDKTIAVVKSTAPYLQENAEALTRHFYKRMFAHNPEVLEFFNPAHQATGNQQNALAGAICAYAANIDNLAVLGGAVELIAQKHVSLQIKPQHYSIVGENLLASIREMLGEGASDEIMDAWAKAYGFLTDILTGREREIYHEQASAVGGWEGFKLFRVARKEPESEVITSFYLVPADGGKLPRFKPGQYITLRVPTAEGHTTMRNYSLSDKPGQDWLRISVKREAGQEAQAPEGFVSNFLHRNVAVGDVVELAAPCGEFFLDVTEHHTRPLVLLAAGVGITPLLSILLSAVEAAPEREIILVHGVLNRATQAFRPVIDAIAARCPNVKLRYRYSDPSPGDVLDGETTSAGFIDAELIEALVPERDGDYYFCGPKPFMVGIYHQLLTWGVPASQVHFEFFGPRQALERPAQAA